MKRISFNFILNYYKKDKQGKTKFFYKNEDNEYVFIEPCIDDDDNIDDFYDEDNSYIKEDMPLSKLMNLKYYMEVED